MSLDDHLDSRKIDLIHKTILFSDILPEHTGPTTLRSKVRVVHHDTVNRVGATIPVVYEITSGIVMVDEKIVRRRLFGKYDALDRAVSLNAKVFSDLATERIDSLVYPEDDPADENKEIKIQDFNRAMAFLSTALRPPEYSFLMKLVETDPEAVMSNFRLTESYVRNELAQIREKLCLAMSLHPELSNYHTPHQLDMERALENHVLGMYAAVRTGVERTFPRGFFQDDSRRKSRILTRFIVEQEMDLKGADVLGLSREDFSTRALGAMLRNYHNGSPKEAIDNGYPGMFKPWERAIKFYWEGEEGKQHAIEATRWLVEEQLGWSPEQAKDIGARHFRENGLAGMLSGVYGSSPQRAIMAAYPKMFKPWHFESVPLGYWGNGEEGRQRAIEAVKWLIEEKLKLEPKDIGQLTKQDFHDHGINGALQVVYSGSKSAAVMDAYPGQFMIIGKGRQSRLALKE